MELIKVLDDNKLMLNNMIIYRESLEIDKIYLMYTCIKKNYEKYSTQYIKKNNKSDLKYIRNYYNPSIDTLFIELLEKDKKIAYDIFREYDTVEIGDKWIATIFITMILAIFCAHDIIKGSISIILIFLILYFVNSIAEKLIL